MRPSVPRAQLSSQVAAPPPSVLSLGWPGPGAGHGNYFPPEQRVTELSAALQILSALQLIFASLQAANNAPIAPK